MEINIDRLHYVANNIDNLERGDGLTFFYCHEVFSIVDLLIEKNEQEALIVIFLNRYQFNHVLLMLKDIFSSYKINNETINLNINRMNPWGLYSIYKDIMIKFATDENEVSGFENYYFVDMRDNE